jgi:bacterioferritin-associated ferredoxin
MIVCSCNAISDTDIENVLIDIFSRPDSPIPTPGLVYRELSKRMQCCSCTPLAVNVIYERLVALERRGAICRFRCADIRNKLRLIINKATTRHATAAQPGETEGTGRSSASKIA